MHYVKNMLATGSVAALLAIGGMTAIPTPASAEVACNGAGECWQVNRHYEYPKELGIHIYGDDWRRSHEHDTHYRWMKERNEHGYYANGEWHVLGR